MEVIYEVIILIMCAIQLSPAHLLLHPWSLFCQINDAGDMYQAIYLDSFKKTHVPHGWVSEEHAPRRWLTLSRCEVQAV